jgi:transposase
MSPSKIQRLFGFYNHKITDIAFSGASVTIEFARTPRAQLCCPSCKNPQIRLYGTTTRVVRDLSVSNRVVYLKIPQNKIYCSRCGVRTERISFLDTYARHTRRFERFVHTLCRHMTVSDVARVLALSWHEVKHIDKKYLEKQYRIPPWRRLRFLGVDEVAVRTGHRYLTVVVNLCTGQVVYVGKDRKQATLDRFLARIGPHRRHRIKAVAMDLWRPYAAAVGSFLPNAKIVYDKFHLLAAFSRVIDRIRRKEFLNASQKDKGVIKGSRYLLLKNKSSLSGAQQARLAQLLCLNVALNTTYILKDELSLLWNCPDKDAAEKHLLSWIEKATSTAIPALKSFAKTLEKHRQGILNYFDIPITTAQVEGINNKIKVLKRKAYGFMDLVYFSLKIYDLHNLKSGYG